MKTATQKEINTAMELRLTNLMNQMDKNNAIANDIHFDGYKRLTSRSDAQDRRIKRLERNAVWFFVSMPIVNLLLRWLL